MTDQQLKARLLKELKAEVEKDQEVLNQPAPPEVLQQLRKVSMSGSGESPA